MLQDVYKSESDTNQRNQAIGALMLAYGYIKANWQQAVDLYTRQCSIGVNAKDLATMAATLADGGKNPVTGKQVMDADKVPGVLAVMATAGLYDDSGKWLYHTGLPAKSGVGGGIIAVSPGKFGIAVVSPPLDEAGNSVRAQRAIADISNALGGNPYAPARSSRRLKQGERTVMRLHHQLPCARWAASRRRSPGVLHAAGAAPRPSPASSSSRPAARSPARPNRRPPPDTSPARSRSTC